MYNYSLSCNEYGQERPTSGRGRFSKRRQNINNGYAPVDCNGDNKETVAATPGTTAFADVGRVNGTSMEKFRSAVSGRRANVLREIFQLDTRSLLLEKAKAAVRKKLQDLNISASTQFAEKGKAKRKEKHVDNNVKVNGVLSDNPSHKFKMYNS